MDERIIKLDLFRARRDEARWWCEKFVPCTDDPLAGVRIAEIDAEIKLVREALDDSERTGFAALD